MTAVVKCRLIDFGFATAILMETAIPLVFLRYSPWLHEVQWPTVLSGIIAATAVLWAALARRFQKALPADPPSQNGPEECEFSAWWQSALIAALLGAVTLVNFYRPMTIHFWGGVDEFCNLIDFKSLANGMAGWDRGMNRPLTALPSVVGQSLAPGRIDGFLWLAAGLCWINGVLLFATLREVLPRARVLSVAAAVLLVIDRSDPARYFVMWCSNFYWTALALLLLGVWLFVRSYRLGSRFLLVLSCLSLGGALLTNEAAYPLAMLGPVLAWCVCERRRCFLAWIYLWAGTIALFATRFLLFLVHCGTGAYQANKLSDVCHDHHLLLRNLQLHLRAGLTNFQLADSLRTSWKAALATLVIVMVLVAIAAWRTVELSKRRHYGIILGISASALLLGIVPGLPLPGVFRTQFFAAPGQAVFLAGTLCMVGSLFGCRAGNAIVVITVGLFAANSTSAAISAQWHARASSPITFERTTHVLRQIHGICPNPLPGTIILLIPADPNLAPLGANYACLNIGQNFLGASLAQVGVRDGFIPPPEFRLESVVIGENSESFHAEAGYDKLLLFKAASDGTITLVRSLPAKLLRSQSAAALYSPMPLLRPGPVTELTYFRYPRWADRPHDLFDMADGVVLGQGWRPLEYDGRELFRGALDRAELVINSFGQNQRELHLRIDAGGTGRLHALDLNGAVVATAPMNEKQDVVLVVPTDPARASLIRLRVCLDTGAASTFKVICPGGPWHSYQPAQEPRSDIVADDLDLGANWYALETFGGQTFRWVANDAEITIPACTPVGSVLVLELEPGPALGSEPCRLTFLEENGRPLSTTVVERRQMIRLPLPAGGKNDKVLRLHVESPGLGVPNDARTLNFRVFRVALESD